MKHLGIFLFDEVEVLDFAGPFEVFSVSSELRKYQHLKVFTFGTSMKLIRTVNGLKVQPEYDLNSVPEIDYLVIPGGDGTKKVIQNEDLLGQLAGLIKRSEWTMSVCSGSRILGKAGFLNQKPYCTHQLVFESMREIVPDGQPEYEKRFVQSDEKIWTAAGISAGIDLALHLCELTFGHELASETAQYMEYLPYLQKS
jgi:transcriptional regulator GlxA family with amidase domain